MVFNYTMTENGFSVNEANDADSSSDTAGNIFLKQMWVLLHFMFHKKWHARSRPLRLGML